MNNGTIFSQMQILPKNCIKIKWNYKLSNFLNLPCIAQRKAVTLVLSAALKVWRNAQS